MKRIRALGAEPQIDALWVQFSPDRQQLAIQLGGPIPVQTIFLKDVIEGQPMHVLGIGERTVNIENNRLKCLHETRSALELGLTVAGSLSQSC